MNKKQLYKAIHSHSGNICFFSNDDLCQVIDDCSVSDCVYCLAEIFFRWFVGGMCDKQMETTINSKLSDGEFQKFRSFIECNVKCYSKGSVFNSNWYDGKSDFLMQCQAAIRNRFKKLFDDTDGFIPVYSEVNGRAFFIPFHLEESSSNIVVNEDDCEIPQWTLSLDNLCLGKKIKLVLHCSNHFAYLFDSACTYNVGTFVGNSFLLPVYIGFLRREGQIPKFAVWKLLSTGSFSEQHSLVSVATKEKVVEFQRLFPSSIMLLPESSNSSNDVHDNVYTLPLMGINELFLYLRDFIERKSVTLENFAYFNYDYAIGRVNEFIDLIRHKNQGDWEARIAQVDALLVPLDEWSNINEYLSYMTAKEEVFCHSGNAGEALRLCEEIEDFAKKHGCQLDALRIAVNRLVGMTDTLNFNGIFQYAVNLEQRLIDFKDNDLLMRYYGTMGQACAYASLYSRRKDLSLKSRQYFSNALENVAKLKDRPDFCMELAQDKNYWHLWHVLFSPGSSEEEKAFRSARNHLECNLQDKEENRKKNLAYLMRQRAFALYRYYLQSGKCLDLNFHDFKITERGENWVYVTTLKYIATLMAARGDIGKAREMFTMAMSVSLRSYPIFNFIRLTVILQAAFSLHDNSLFSKSKNIIELLNHTEYEEMALHWFNCVQQGIQPPALEYWY